eukprot:INCI3290.4.p1 GENE.INCI3290.4~~INCI3290.4.p1  ORF type:complete len:324 (-),score=44.26 INCI3290.4:226-1197(-)
MQATLSTKKGVASGGRSSSSRSSRSDFGTVKADDCETSFRAVQDIAPFVEAVADVIGKSRESVVVYDPYYCKGSVSAHWKKLGFKNFVNRDADFYAQARSKETPRHDVLVTNPPYSGDHIRRLLDFATKPPLNKQPRSNHKLHQAGSSGDEIDGKEVPTFTPFAILIPTHVLAQNWVGDLLQRRGLPPMAYVAPSQQRYSFTCSPTNEVSPLETMWFIGGFGNGSATQRRIEAAYSTNGQMTVQSGGRLSLHFKDLPRRIRKVHRYSIAREKKRKPKKERRKAQQGPGVPVKRHASLDAAFPNSKKRSSRPCATKRNPKPSIQ